MCFKCNHEVNYRRVQVHVCVNAVWTCMCANSCLYLSMCGWASAAQFERCLMSLAQEAVDLLTSPSTSTELPAVGLQSVKWQRERRREGEGCPGWAGPQSCPGSELIIFSCKLWPEDTYTQWPQLGQQSLSKFTIYHPFVVGHTDS